MDAHDAGYVSPYQIAMVQARLGDDAQALHWLAEAARQIDFNVVCLPVDPAFDALRQPAGRQLMRASASAIWPNRPAEGPAGTADTPDQPRAALSRAAHRRRAAPGSRRPR
jgi:hypothetical protein